MTPRRNARRHLGVSVVVGVAMLTSVGTRAASDGANGALAMSRFGYGVRGSERATLTKVTWADTIARQLAYETIDDGKSDAAVRAAGELSDDAATLMAKYPRPKALEKNMQRVGQTAPPAGELEKPRELAQIIQARRLVRAVTTERQLYEAMVELWLDHFNVFAAKKGVVYALPAYERDAIRPNALGSFETLLRSVAESPAMLIYLDNDDNVRPGGPAPRQAFPEGVDLTQCQYLPPEQAERLMRRAEKAKRGVVKPPAATAPDKPKHGINENYARELLELHTLGVDGGYTQKDVTEVARAFTGWTVFDEQGNGGCPGAGRAFFAPELHEPGDKTVLGTVIKSGGRDEGLAVLSLLAHHPKTAQFIAMKIARRFVSDTPPAAVVERAAQVFVKTNGNIREVVRTIANDPMTIAAVAKHEKVKRPFDLVVSALRALDATTDGRKIAQRYLGGLNQLPYGWQTPNGYPEEAARWTNAGALTQRLRFGLDLASNTIDGTEVDLGALLGDEVAYGGGETAGEELVDTAAARLLGAGVSEGTKKTIVAAIADTDETRTVARGDKSSVKANTETALSEPSRKPDPRAARTVGLLLGSPEFQHR